MSPVPTSATLQRIRQARTTPTATRHGLPWTAPEDTELAECVTDNDLEQFAMFWGRRFLSVDQRHRRPRPSPSVVPTGTGWVR